MSSTPDCPICQHAMVRRVAKQGTNAGKAFWGCSQYSNSGCGGRRKMGPSGSEGNQAKTQPEEHSQFKISTAWPGKHDSVLSADYVAQYCSIGSRPGFLNSFKITGPAIKYGVMQSLMLSKRNMHRSGVNHEHGVSSIILKLLSRGAFPLCTLEVEDQLAKCAKSLPQIKRRDEEDSSTGWHWNGAKPADIAAQTTGIWSERSKPSPKTLDLIRNSDLFDSDNEKAFLLDWVPENLGVAAVHWFTPQAPLDLLLTAHGQKSAAERRIDFLFFAPARPAVAIELDGQEHQDAQEIDQERDRQLKSIRIRTIRIPNAEIHAQNGPALNRLKQYCLEALQQTSSPRQEIGSLITHSIDATRIQVALAKALELGKLTVQAPQWEININAQCCPESVATAAVNDFRRMLSACLELYGQDGSSAPEIQFAFGGQINSNPDLSIGIYSLESPLSITDAHQDEDILFCPVALPVNLLTVNPPNQKPLQLKELTLEQANKPLTFFLQTLFRKRKFREQQCEALLNTLKGKDTIVLLPTGAGKSIIYQLGGLLQPGLTLVVDPLVALIEDQLLGLARVGIDNAAGIFYKASADDRRTEMLHSVKHNNYQFLLIAPERLQIPSFRNALSALAEKTFINLAVIDEAHCVSQWGHDFRFAYLNLAANLKQYGASSSSPPSLLALTGTASRSVLRDMMTELKINTDDSDCLIRPISFNRPKLKFSIRKSKGKNDERIQGWLNALPGKFNLPEAEFYKPSGENTNSGIVFVLHAGDRQGLVETRKKIKAAINAKVTVFSGECPKEIESENWEKEKRKNADLFKNNDVPILVATNAFGMGIDKPNIRWTLHASMPSSIEAFYQEAGRAGRDNYKAYCHIVFTEIDPKKTDELLDDTKFNIKQLEAKCEALSKQYYRNHVVDDVINVLRFHFGSFPGVDSVCSSIKKILDKIQPLDTEQQTQILAGDKKHKLGVERAILHMLRSGLIDDYSYGSKRFTLDVRSFDFDYSRKLIYTYIKEVQPATAQHYDELLNQVARAAPNEQPAKLCYELVKFTYDVIERSRRRQIYEIVRLCRGYAADDEIRTFLSDYLQEGLAAEDLDKLARKEAVDFSDWLELFDTIETESKFDAGVIRGTVIRVMETYPDHPGLLITRGLAEALASNADESTTKDSLLSAFRAGIDRYSCTESQLNNLAIELINFASKSEAVNLRLPLISTLHDFPIQNGDVFVHLEDEACSWDQITQMINFLLQVNKQATTSIKHIKTYINHYQKIAKTYKDTIN